MPVDAAAEDAEVVVLFDGGCPLCKREIAHYRRLDAGRNRIAWVDLYATPERAAEWGIDPRVALQRMHVIERGQPRVGASAFVAMWRVLPYYRVLGRVFDTVPGLTSFADRVYRAFARRRWRSRCASGTCPIPSAYRAPLQDEPTNGRS
ncbi:MAG: thiol-disulfide oxidoreductase DCC family protein [Thioalkalivibrionaceae bacterium]